jgi:hypothetical protein
MEVKNNSTKEVAGWIKKGLRNLVKIRGSSAAYTITVIGGVNVARLPPVA